MTSDDLWCAGCHQAPGECVCAELGRTDAELVPRPDDLEPRVAEALRDTIEPMFCGRTYPVDRADVVDFLAPVFAAALRATAARGVFAGRETMLLLDRKDEWPAVERAKQNAEAAGLAALEGK